MYFLMKRFFDISISLCCIIIFLPLFLILGFLVKFTSKGPILYWSNRVGKNNIIFSMPKLRSLKINTPVLPTHLLVDSGSYLTPVGSFLRKSSLDELPQLWCILIGVMSFVGPRPALFNQDDLILMRSQCGVDKLTPGLTGLAQINGRDDLDIPQKVQYDLEYLQKKSLYFDLKILTLTFSKVFYRSGISH